MIKKMIYFLPLLLVAEMTAQELGTTFEMRKFSKEAEANGETDFKGESESMGTNERIDFLNDYAKYASSFFDNPNLDKQLVSIEEVDSLLESIKPQPLPKIRKTIVLDNWKSYGFREGQDLLKEGSLKYWATKSGLSVVENALRLEDTNFNQSIDTLDWRFIVRTTVRVSESGTLFLSFNDSGKNAIALALKNGQLTVNSNGKEISEELEDREWVTLEIEADFTQKRFNIVADGVLISDFIPMSDTSVTAITGLTLSATGRADMDDIFIFKHELTDNINSPYSSTVLMDEDFEKKPDVTGWQLLDFDDTVWKQVKLPSVHGGTREQGEDYYLRKKLTVGDFERATLMIEAIDPGGEVWINNQVVAVVNSRHPVEVDVSKYLRIGVENVIAIKVNTYQMTYAIGHAPSDPHTGWFLGRAKLLLTDRCMIKDLQTFTRSMDNSALQTNRVFIQYGGRSYYKGILELNYYPWFPEEGLRVSTVRQEVEIRPDIVNEFVIELAIPTPQFWTSASPQLYRVEVILKDTAGKAIDDFVTTTGIRTVGQDQGYFLFNGKPELLNGAQIMGFRTPIETISKTTRCANEETIIEELLSIKKMNGNLLRMHVHAERDKSDGINDPRYAEFADQLGICLIWQTPAWTRSGNVWHIDFEGYALYMKQVYNHPSIVIWEAGNHPNRFQGSDLKETNDYVKKIYNSIYPFDQSRLISPTTFWQHTHYGNYDGTVDYKGDEIVPVPEYMAKMVTRGSQDAYSGYGHTWTEIREMPNSFAASCLAANEKAYFNFEHEESAGQPNWELCKGKPWYLMQSYEWDYDVGSIGRKLSQSEWRASQAWQAFSAWESMKKQILIGYDGFSWCCLHGGANMGTYQKPLIDNLGHPKLSYYINKMVFQSTWAGSKNVDVVYGPDDLIIPVINHLGEPKNVKLMIQLKMLNGRVLQEKAIENIELSGGHCIKELDAFQFKNVSPGTYVINYEIINQ